MKEAAALENKAAAPHDIFISYSRKDKEFVGRLDDELKARGREAWVDWEGIRPTEEFMEAIFGAIESADTFVFVLTPDSIASKICAKEIGHAAQHNKRIIPIVARDVDAALVPEAIAKLNWIFGRESDGFAQSVDTLVTAFDTDLEWVHAHTRLLTRALEWEANKKSSSFALHGEDLRAAEQWLAQAGTEKERQPTSLQTEYIIASRKASARRQRITLGAVTFGFIVAMVLAMLALFARKEAIKQEATAKTTSVQADYDLALLYRQQSAAVEPRTLAHLARALRTQPDAALPRNYLVSLLRDSLWHLPRTEPLPQPDIQKVMAASFSPDGRRVVVASKAGWAAILDSKSGGEIGKRLPHSAAVVGAQFSADGARILTVSWNKTACIWDAVTGKPAGQTLIHSDLVMAASFTPDRQKVLTLSRDGVARLWEIESGKLLSEPFRCEAWGYPPRPCWVANASFCADGSRVFIVSTEGTGQLWDTAEGRPMGNPLSHGKLMLGASLSPDGQKIVTLSNEGDARLWDAERGIGLGEPLRDDGVIVTASFSPDGRRLITGSTSKTARIWDVESHALFGEPLRHEADVEAAVFSPDGSSVFTAAADNTVQFWEVQDSKPPRPRFGNYEYIRIGACTPDGRRILTATSGATAELWDAESGRAIGEPLRHEGAMQQAQFSPDGRRVITASSENVAQLWDAEDGHRVGSALRHEGEIVAIGFSADSRRVITGSRDHTAQVCESETGKVVRVFRPETEVLAASLSFDGQRAVVVTGPNHSGQIWDVVSGQAIGEPLTNAQNAEFSPSGDRILSRESSRASLWDATTGKRVGLPMEHKDSLHSASFSSDGRRIVTAGGDWTARIWSARDAALLWETPRQEDHLRAAVFSPDCRWIVTTSEGRSARVWAAESGKPAGEPLRHADSGDVANFSADSSHIATGSGDKTARIWTPKLASRWRSPSALGARWTKFHLSQKAGGFSRSLPQVRKFGTLRLILIHPFRHGRLRSPRRSPVGASTTGDNLFRPQRALWSCAANCLHSKAMTSGRILAGGSSCADGSARLAPTRRSPSASSSACRQKREFHLLTTNRNENNRSRERSSAAARCFHILLAQGSRVCPASG